MTIFYEQATPDTPVPTMSTTTEREVTMAEDERKTTMTRKDFNALCKLTIRWLDNRKSGLKAEDITNMRSMINDFRGVMRANEYEHLGLNEQEAQRGEQVWTEFLKDISTVERSKAQKYVFKRALIVGVAIGAVVASAWRST